MVLGMTHEEIITWHAAREIRSYRDLPQAWYQIQTKLRDEPRAKSGHAARARVHDEGLLLARPRPGRPRRVLRRARGGLLADHGPLRAPLVHGRERHRDDGRHRRPRVHGAEPRGRGHDRARPGRGLCGERRGGRLGGARAGLRRDAGGAAGVRHPRRRDDRRARGPHGAAAGAPGEERRGRGRRRPRAGAGAGRARAAREEADAARRPPPRRPPGGDPRVVRRRPGVARPRGPAGRLARPRRRRHDARPWALRDGGEP